MEDGRNNCLCVHKHFVNLNDFKLMLTITIFKLDDLQQLEYIVHDNLNDNDNCWKKLIHIFGIHIPCHDGSKGMIVTHL